jgi:hypothetical protein
MDGNPFILVGKKVSNERCAQRESVGDSTCIQRRRCTVAIVEIIQIVAPRLALARSGCGK